MLANPGPGGHQCDARPARQPPPRVRHVYRGRLLPHVVEVDVPVHEGVVYRHDLVAGQREDMPRPGIPQSPHNPDRPLSAPRSVRLIFPWVLPCTSIGLGFGKA